MKNKKKQLGKLSFKKSTVAGLDSSNLVGGTGNSFFVCGDSIVAYCNSGNCGSLNCTNNCGSANCGTGNCGSANCGTGNCGSGNCGSPTDGCPPTSLACPSLSVCPQGFACY